jgi:hypothetical protein
MDRVLFLGGNGHCTARLDPARDALARRIACGSAPFALDEVRYPGFEDRPHSPSFDAFLDEVARQVEDAAARGRVLVYATGIGGLFLLCLRECGRPADVPFVLQAPVLWGLERRWMPRLMRLGFARLLLRRLFAVGPFQAWFVRRQFERPPAAALRRAFFDGYGRCAAAADFFDWLTPPLLRRLELGLRGRPERLGRITVWWGGRDRVVTLRELAWTEQALGVRWPLRTFPAWGHYPMIDDPDGWVKELSRALADLASLP